MTDGSRKEAGTRWRNEEYELLASLRFGRKGGGVCVCVKKLAEMDGGRVLHNL